MPKALSQALFLAVLYHGLHPTAFGLLTHFVPSHMQLEIYHLCLGVLPVSVYQLGSHPNLKAEVGCRGF